MPRVTVQYRTASRKVYEKFCATHPQISLTYDKWLEIIYTFNYALRDHILETGDRCKLPWGFGTLSIEKRKVKKFIVHNGKEYIALPIDWPKSRKLGKRVYHLNAHTDGYRYKWYWFRADSRLYQSEIWVFKPSRVSSRKLAEYLKRPNSHYPQIYREWRKKKY